MPDLLTILLNGSTFDQAIEQSKLALQEMAARKNTRTFKVTNNNGFITTQLYVRDDEKQKVVIG